MWYYHKLNVSGQFGGINLDNGIYCFILSIINIYLFKNINKELKLNKADVTLEYFSVNAVAVYSYILND